MSIKFTKEQIDSLSKVIREVMDASERYSFEKMEFFEKGWNILINNDQNGVIKFIRISTVLYNGEVTEIDHLICVISFKDNVEVWNNSIFDKKTISRIKEILPWKV